MASSRITRDKGEGGVKDWLVEVFDSGLVDVLLEGRHRSKRARSGLVEDS